jgi:hypothetical protein
MRCTEGMATARTACLLARRRLGEKARASCKSGRETDRRSTTATVQGICPFCYDGLILGSCAIECQLIFESLRNVVRHTKLRPARRRIFAPPTRYRIGSEPSGRARTRRMNMHAWRPRSRRWTNCRSLKKPAASKNHIKTEPQKLVT